MLVEGVSRPGLNLWLAGVLVRDVPFSCLDALTAMAARLVRDFPPHAKPTST